MGLLVKIYTSKFLWKSSMIIVTFVYKTVCWEFLLKIIESFVWFCQLKDIPGKFLWKSYMIIINLVHKKCVLGIPVESRRKFSTVLQVKRYTGKFLWKSSMIIVTFVCKRVWWEFLVKIVDNFLWCCQYTIYWEISVKIVMIIVTYVYKSVCWECLLKIVDRFLWFSPLKYIMGNVCGNQIWLLLILCTKMYAGNYCWKS